MAGSNSTLATAGRWHTVPRSILKARLPWITVIILLTLVLCAILAPLAPYDPTYVDLIDARIPPFETLKHPLGTDVMGRDMLTRLVYGSRTAMFMAVVALGSGALVGTVLGLVAGYRGGWLDAIIMRTVDATMGFPTILVAMVLVVIMGVGTTVIILAVALTVWDTYARMIRGEVLAVKELEYVTLAKIAGVSGPVIIWRHIFPSVANVLLVITSLRVGQVILLEASLSFLGLGVAPGDPAWGVMVSEGRNVMLKVWWLSLFPGIAITIVVVAFNFLGDWLRDALDPKLRRA